MASPASFEKRKWTPPYIRESETCRAHSSQVGRVWMIEFGTACEPTRTPPGGRGPVSASITSAIAAATVQWPHGYSGKLGVASKGIQLASSWVVSLPSLSALRTAVIGRQKL